MHHADRRPRSATTHLATGPQIHYAVQGNPGGETIVFLPVYAFTFMDFPGRDLLFWLIVALLVVPNQMALAPLPRIYGDLNLTGTYAAVYLAHIGFGMPLASSSSVATWPPCPGR